MEFQKREQLIIPCFLEGVAVSSYWTWGVDEIIFNIWGPFSLRWYSLLFLSGLLLGHYLFNKMVKAENKPLEPSETAFAYIVVGTVLGARLGHCLFYDPAYYFAEPLRILKIWEGGLASHGGYIGVITAAYLLSRKVPEYQFLWFIDRVSIVAILCGTFIRLGNFFNSEILGKVTDVSWAVIFTRHDQQPRHPAQLYEAFAYALISLILYMVYRHYKRRPLPGRILGLALCLGFSFRFLIENYKENQVGYENSMLINMGQSLSLPLMLIGLCMAAGFHLRFFPGQAKKMGLKKGLSRNR